MMDRVRKAYLQDQRYMTTFVRILLVPLSAPLSYDFKGGGESTRDGRVKFTDLTEATGYHSCMNNYEPVVWENISEFQRKYGGLTGKMMGDLILASAFYNSRATHVTKVRQILERDPEYDANSGDFTNQLEKMTQFQVVERTKAYEIHMQGSQALFEKPSLSRAEAELKKKEQEGKTQKYDKCHMRHNPAGGCVKAELAMKAFELSGPLVKVVAQAELTAKQSVIKTKEKEIRSSDIKLLESLVRELHTLDSTLNKMYQQAGPGRRHPNGKAKIEYANGKDCHRWLNGDYNRKECIFNHDPSKKGKDPTAGKPDKDPTKADKDLLTNAAADEKNQTCKFWARGQCVEGGKCPQKHDPAKGRPHKSKDTNSEMPKDMQGIMTRLAQLEAAAQTHIFSGPSAAVEQTTSRDILSIPERTKRAAEAVGVTSYVQLGSSVRSGAARAEFTGVVLDADTLAQLSERDSVQHGERDHEKAPCMESSAGNIQQRQYVRNFEYEYQNRENAITIINDNTGASEIQREEQGIKLALAQIVAARDYFEAAVGSV
jgi:hypothetical protein